MSIDKNIALDADNVFAKIGDVQKTAILLFAEYIDAATTIAAQSGGGGGSATSGWGRDKDEDELSWAYRALWWLIVCAYLARSKDMADNRMFNQSTALKLCQ